MLIAVYLVLAVAATFRSVYQILTKFDEAPIAYALSALAGVVYIVATVALVKSVRRGGRAAGAAGAKAAGAAADTGRTWRVVAWCALVFELAGVLIVGTLSLVAPQLFAHPSVWSQFGMGYVFIPLVLPVLGLLWLRGSGRGYGPAAGGAGAA